MAAVAVVGLLAGLAPFNDNSFFTHLTTGRGIVDSLSVPHTDPYTFTSAAEPWVVQSWLASALYGGLDAVGGVLAIRIFTGVVTAALAALVWRLSRPAGALLPRLALSGGTVLMGIVVWSERPLLLGLLFFALTLALVHEDRIDVRWAVPLFWVWANVHGSFPLGLVLLGTLWVGGLLDRTRPQRTARLLLWSTVGAVLGGVLNPYGVRLLVFPLDLLSKREQLQHVVEWQRPDLGDRYAQIFVVVAVVAVVAAIRSRRWAVVLPVAVFLVAALLGARNVAVASIAFAGIAAPALHGIGSITTSGRGPRARLTLMVAAALALVGSVVLLGRDNFELRAYPVEAVEWIDANGGFGDDARWAHTDTTGNYLTLRFDGAVPIFMDDRMELHPPELIEDYLVLNAGEQGWATVLDRWAIDAVLWPTDRDLAAELVASTDWEAVEWPWRPAEGEFSDSADPLAPPYLIACRTGTPLCDTLRPT
ncbi:MAG: hypothetical protein OEW42_12880 [Acidimicrobiia bacterium]|nr:hypothetical protein [Acidimicrobiia bacterium]